MGKKVRLGKKIQSQAGGTVRQGKKSQTGEENSDWGRKFRLGKKSQAEEEKSDWRRIQIGEEKSG
jgi:hypothetical protein